MFVIYNPEMDTFVAGVFVINQLPNFDWDRRISKANVVDSLDDAVVIANDVREEWLRKECPLYSVQVLRLKSPGLPDFKDPVYDIPSPRRVA